MSGLEGYYRTVLEATPSGKPLFYLVVEVEAEEAVDALELVEGWDGVRAATLYSDDEKPLGAVMRSGRTHDTFKTRGDAP